MSPNPPPAASIDNQDNGEDHQTMESRITALERDVSVLKTDVAVIRSNYVTKEDLQRELHALTWRIIGAIALLNAAVFFLARSQPYNCPPCPPPAVASTAQTPEQPKAAAPISR